MGSYDNWKLDSPSENEEVSECCGEDYDYDEEICMECGEEANVISRTEYILNRYHYEY